MEALCAHMEAPLVPIWRHLVPMWRPPGAQVEAPGVHMEAPGAHMEAPGAAPAPAPLICCCQWGVPKALGPKP